MKTKEDIEKMIKRLSDMDVLMDSGSDQMVCHWLDNNMIEEFPTIVNSFRDEYERYLQKNSYEVIGDKIYDHIFEEYVYSI